ncbi:hypothetical protein M408DRAFT_333189 [Serendipita vermifera MAFF 305830]|uniref:Copper transport protein n=1 Tax=Serendipita vermifera MAFF 305830 TaxID=933852 RepID=A0A0C2WWW8_SERVB|nr:hypothetical protein M408DRAFT_333189 [Serendipita vermifera MAFF 305830]
MDMGSDSMAQGPACKISMLWNWYTVDSCFVSKDWHIRSEVAFAFNVICVFILVALVEGVRRYGREYDRRIVRLASLNNIYSGTDLSGLEEGLKDGIFVPTWPQQAIRASIFGIQFGAAYILMLLAMYYNGFIIFAIILGGTAGYFIFGRDTVVGGASVGENGAACC